MGLLGHLVPVQSKGLGGAPFSLFLSLSDALHGHGQPKAWAIKVEPIYVLPACNTTSKRKTEREREVQSVLQSVGLPSDYAQPPVD